MEKVNFGKLAGKRGKATKVPAYLEEVCTYDGKPKPRGHRGSEPEAYEQLMLELVGASEWYSASAPAVDELLRRLGEGARRDIGLALVTDIACADHVQGWMAPPNATRIPPEVMAILLQHRETVLASLADGDERTRAAAAMLVGCVDGWCREYRGRLLELAQTDAASQVQASAALALGRAAEGDSELQDVLTAMSSNGALDPLVRGAAAIAWLRSDPTTDVAAVSDALADWLGCSLNGGATKLHWFGAVWSSWTASKQALPATARVFATLARSRGEEEKAIQVALAAVERKRTGESLDSVSKLVLDLGGFLAEPGKVPHTLPPHQFTAGQQRLLPLLAASVVPVAAGYGLPAAGANRRRWLGAEPAGPLERKYEELNGEPLWKVCQETPVELPPSLTGVERWKALIELRANPYGRAPKHNIENELRELVASPAWYDEISLTIDEVASRGEIAQLIVPSPLAIGRSFGDTAMLPLLRAGLPVKDRWLQFAWSSNREVNPELVRLLPLAQREHLLCRIFASKPESWILEDLQHVSLAPTPKVVKAAVSLLKQAEAGGWLNLETFVGLVRALVAEHPWVADALREAELAEPIGG